MKYEFKTKGVGKIATHQAIKTSFLETNNSFFQSDRNVRKVLCGAKNE